MHQRKFSPMNLRKYTNAVNAEKRLILHPVHMKRDKSSCNFLPGTIFRQEIDPSGFAPIHHQKNFLPGNNKSETARRLGISRRTLHLKLKDYGVMP